MTAPAITREAWLHNAIEMMRPMFKEAGADIPERLHISIGFSFGAKAESKVIQGQCWSKVASKDGVPTIFISPEMGDPVKVLMVLVHELVHASDDCKSGHRGFFVKVMKALGMTAPFTDSIASEAFTDELKWISRQLGVYPHGAFIAREIMQKQREAKLFEKLHQADDKAHTDAMDRDDDDIVASGPKPQTARMLKYVDNTAGCPAEGYIVRTTAKWAAMGAPKCPYGCVLTAE